MLPRLCLDKYRDKLPNFVFYSSPRPLKEVDFRINCDNKWDLRPEYNMKYIVCDMSKDGICVKQPW